MTADLGPLDQLVERATSLAGTLGAMARASTSLGQERAILRLFGVSGLDREGRPLAGAVVDRWMRGSREGLGSGVTLPFAMGLLEYDLDPQHLALDVASGTIDLALESELLLEPDRRAVAETEARRLAHESLDRIDSDRIARHELTGLLGDAPRPWVGVTMTETELGGALNEVGTLVTAGADVLRVEVPIGRELADRLHDAGLEVNEWRPAERRATGSHARIEPAPTGSQRALAEVRRAADRLAAQRRAYVRIETAAQALWAPEHAVVAAFERVDLVEVDPMAEIVASGVDPDRTLSDHAFAYRLHRHAGTMVVVGAGSLVVAPDLRVGVPSDPATRSGRALALQLLAVSLALAEGMAPSQVAVSALPPWITDEPWAGARAIAEVEVRRALLPGHPLAFAEPEVSPEAAADWPQLLAAVLVRAGDAALVMRRPGRTSSIVRDTRAAARVATEAAAAREPSDLAGVAAEHARMSVEVALATLEMLADRGWRAVSPDPHEAGPRSIGAEGVATRTEAFDAFA
jgi:hypothetical protein